MAKTGFEGIDHSVQQTHLWINQLNESLGWNNQARSFRFLRVVLHALRDCLEIEEAVHFASQFPSIIRGIYYEQWRPSVVPIKHRAKKDFLARVSREFMNDPIQNREAAVATVFAFLADKVSAGEIDDVKQALKQDLRALWPGVTKAA